MDGTTSPAEVLTPPHAAAATPPRVRVAGNELTLYTETPPMIAAMIEDIRQAQSRVWLETYIFLDDETGRAVAEALAERARAGVEVRVLYDYVGSLDTPDRFFQNLADAGAEVHAYHSLGEAFWRFSPLRILNRRNHRKLLVVDDRAAYFGGMNITNPGAEKPGGRGPSLPPSAGWRDVHARIEGPRQADVAESFDRSWRRAHGERIARRPKAYRQCVLDRGEESIQFFDSGPGLRHTRAGRIFLRLIRSARRRLTLSMAYFVPVGAVLRQLLRAHKRGVFIQVVVPGESDVPIVQRASRHLYGKLLHRRFHLYERQQRMIHSKVLVADDAWTILGSANLDARSLWINLEFLAVVHSQALARAVQDIIQEDIRASQRMTRRAYAKRTTWQRLLDRAAWSLRWWL